jgi:hypothetical protein
MLMEMEIMLRSMQNYATKFGRNYAKLCSARAIAPSYAPTLVEDDKRANVNAISSIRRAMHAGRQQFENGLY